MNVRRAAALAVAAALAAGCGSGGGARGGRATIWITRDRGAHVLVDRRVPAGLSALQALERVAKVDTQYGGRFVRGIDGVSSASHRDWFYYVNGYLADRGAADYRLHPGDVEWWDYRAWRNPAEDPVVVGTFPEPFLHGYDGKRRPALVVGPRGATTQRIARLLHARQVVEKTGWFSYSSRANILELVPARTTRFTARNASATPGAPVSFTFRGDLAALARNPHLARFRYSLP